MTTRIASPQTAAHAVLVDQRGYVLLVHPSYKKRWHLPGGYAHPGELPSAGVIREVREELGIAPVLPKVPAVIAWAPHCGDRLVLYYVAACPGETARQARINGHEIIGMQWTDPGTLNEWLHPAVADRVRLALEANRRQQVVYVEPPTRT